MKVTLPNDWQEILGAELEKPYFQKLSEFVDGERSKAEVFPPEDEVFSAFNLAPYQSVKVVLLGQDPYHDNNQAHGLCFSVKPGITPPPSLVNMYKELETDISGFKRPRHGYLTHWASQGMLMINAVLTVRAHEPNSHKDQGWEQFTDAVIKAVNNKPEHVVFLLWGGYAQKKGKSIDRKRHTVIECAHPSPLSAKKFFGSAPFSATNAALEDHGQSPIDWQLPSSV
jgi:uracil-DNA glycosylase